MVLLIKHIFFVKHIKHSSRFWPDHRDRHRHSSGTDQPGHTNPGVPRQVIVGMPNWTCPISILGACWNDFSI